MLDVGSTTLLNTDAFRAKINVRPRNKRAPTLAHLRPRQEATELDDNDNATYQTDGNSVIDNAGTDEQAEKVSCCSYSHS